MCIAVAIFQGKRLNQEHAWNCWSHNPDGAGYCFADKGKVVIKKGFMTFADFWEAYSKEPHLDERAHLVHFRISTSGMVDGRNTHPWKIGEDLAMIHNGILNFPNTKTTSDTGCFAYGYLRNIRKGMGSNYIMWNKSFHNACLPVLGSSKVCFLDGTGRIQILNDQKGSYEDKSGEDETAQYFNRWFSNDSWKYADYRASKRNRKTETFYPEHWMRNNPSRYPRNGNGLDPNRNLVRMGEYAFIPMSARFREDGTTYISDYQMIKEFGWTLHSDDSWSPPKGWVNPDEEEWANKFHKTTTNAEVATKNDAGTYIRHHGQDWKLDEESGKFFNEKGQELHLNNNMRDWPSDDEEEDYGEYTVQTEIEELISETESFNNFQKEMDAQEKLEQRVESERDSMKHEMAKTHVLVPKSGRHYSVRRCDLALELASHYNVSWSLMESFDDETLAKVAVDMGALNEEALASLQNS